MKELIIEIFTSIRKNKLRTILTGFSVAWGIFMLIVLLGSGNGLKNAALGNFGASNTITLYPGYTRIPYEGYNKYRKIELKYEDIQLLKDNIPNIKSVGAIQWLNGQFTYSKKNKSTSGSISGLTPNFLSLNELDITNGRFITERDIDQKRKVAVLNLYCSNILFENSDPIGETIMVDSVGYSVIGVVKRENDNGSSVFIPVTTSNMIYSNIKYNDINNLTVELSNINTLDQANKIEQEMRTFLSKIKKFHKDDKNAIWFSNTMAMILEQNMIFDSISLFIWIIGLGTLMTGIVGVSNIMLVTVKERTNEFGIRKSIGATPSSIVRLILLESIVITITFGYIGLFLGTFLMKIVGDIFEKINASDSYPMFKDPTIDLGIAINATIVLIVAGIIAGYIPARKAAKLKTIDAMRYNK